MKTKQQKIDEINAEYNKIVALALDKCNKIRDPAWAECNKIVDLANAECNKVIDPAWDKKNKALADLEICEHCGK